MNLSNWNFGTFWSTLGLDAGDDLGGRIHPAAVVKALQGYNPLLAHIPAPESGNMVDFGLDVEQARRYAERLAKIADYGCRKELMILWG